MHSTYSSQLEDSYGTFIPVKMFNKVYSVYTKSKTGKKGKPTRGCVIKLVIATSNWGLVLLEWALELSVYQLRSPTGQGVPVGY